MIRAHPDIINLRINITPARKIVVVTLRRDDSITAEREEYIEELPCRGNERSLAESLLMGWDVGRGSGTCGDSERGIS
jgi:hypothetical protein